MEDLNKLLSTELKHKAEYDKETGMIQKTYLSQTRKACEELKDKFSFLETEYNILLSIERHHISGWHARGKAFAYILRMTTRNGRHLAYIYAGDDECTHKNCLCYSRQLTGELEYYKNPKELLLNGIANLVKNMQ